MNIINYLEKFIGKNIIVKLKQQAQEDTTIKSFFDCPESYIINKLMGVGSVGIWLEGFSEITYLCDSDGNEISLDEQQKVCASFSVLIRWDMIEGIAVINEHDEHDVVINKIGFNLEGALKV
jgi:hypothetical protein